MICENCKTAPATFHVTQIDGNECWEKHLCAPCAKLLDVDDPGGFLDDPGEPGTSETAH